MTDSQHIAQFLYSPDPTNVLIGVELYKQQDTETQQGVIDAFLEELERVRNDANSKFESTFEFGIFFIRSLTEFRHLVASSNFLFILEVLEDCFTIAFFGKEKNAPKLTPENFLLLFNP